MRRKPPAATFVSGTRRRWVGASDATVSLCRRCVMECFWLSSAILAAAALLGSWLPLAVPL